MIKKENLNDIIQGCLRKERASQEQLFKLFYSKMMTVCLRYTLDRDTAQELLQDGFIKVFDKLEKYDNSGSFEAWVKRIIVNTCIDNYRKEKRNLLMYEEDDAAFKEIDDSLSNFGDAEMEGINSQIILQAISELSPAYRTVFNLFVIENYSHKEIAETLDISEGTSKSNLAKAKLNLQRTLKSKLKDIY